MFSDFIEFINSRKVLILGFGREGRSTYDIIRRHLPEKEIGISDIKQIEIDDSRVTLHTGKNYIDCLNDYDVIIKTPGISLAEYILPKDIIITCQTDLFLKYSDCICVGVTGTKGKTTVATLLYDMAKKAGKNAILIGNVRLPALDSLEDKQPDVAIVEMSSRQLEFTTASPHIAVLTN
ncbi:MAG: UDP-N-acetylmuramoyl-L-alanine--D-glutamate ligase, partial [Clostridia bacterium]|nr:UDP-N-acetylmuramoyl-L-alanine--D-glutamate ligase [Clostridia bacterium]